MWSFYPWHISRIAPACLFPQFVRLFDTLRRKNNTTGSWSQPGGRLDTACCTQTRAGRTLIRWAAVGPSERSSGIRNKLSFSYGAAVHDCIFVRMQAILRHKYTSRFGRMAEEDRSNLRRSDPSVWNVVCRTIPPRLQVAKVGSGRRVQLWYSRVTIPCGLWPFLYFSPNGGRLFASESS